MKEVNVRIQWDREDIKISRLKLQRLVRNHYKDIQVKVNVLHRGKLSCEDCIHKVVCEIFSYLVNMEDKIRPDNKLKFSFRYTAAEYCDKYTPNEEE